ncbi:MAG: hypothetical protein MUD08_09650 [Cytophagales bacterium]|nr:hypothetical protein [Cytophagales bacterium]
MNTDWQRIFKNAPARSFRSIFVELANLRQQDVSLLPVVSVALLGGQTYTGSVVAYDHTDQRDTLVLHHAPGMHRNGVSYIDASQIAAVGFDDLDANRALVALVSGGKFSTMPMQEPLNKLGFQRFLKEKSDALKIVHPDFTIEADATLLDNTSNFAGTKTYVEKIVAVLQELLADALGKQTLQEKVRRLTLRPGPGPTATLSDGTLAVDIGNETPDEKAIKTAIEKVL